MSPPTGLSRFIVLLFRAFGLALSEVFSVQYRAIGSLADSILKALDVTSVSLGGSTISQTRHRGETYEHRLTRITSSLRLSAAEAQELLDEMERVVNNRAAAIAQVEQKIAELQAQEAEAAQRLQVLQAVKPEAAEELARLVDQSLDTREKRSGKRDYIIFLLGIVFSAILWALVCGYSASY